uniref:Ubinuclein-2-like n=1 Tax=Gouania willdenowi TaxID=441366 RepID=A0A8C5E804_GOUWI
MAEPRKVPFVTISTFNTAPQTPEPGKKRKREDGGGVASGGGGGLFGLTEEGDSDPGQKKPSVRINILLSEPNERGSSEFNYGELVNSSQVKRASSSVPKGLAPPLDPSDPFADDDKERREVEELARKFENKYGVVPKKKKKDRMQDLIDIGYGYDETDPFIDNSEAYDELVPASLTTKHGGFYINTGTLQFRAASDSEGENGATDGNHFKKSKDGEERGIKKRRKKPDGGILEEKKPRKNKVTKSGVSALNVHRPEKKKRKKLMKDSIHLANMLRRFTREKEEMRKKHITPAGLQRPKAPSAPNANSVPTNPPAKPVKPAGNDCSITDLTSDPVVMSLLGTANNDVLQDMMGDLDFGMLDSPQPSSPTQGENGSFGMKVGSGGGRVSLGGTIKPPPLPGGLPPPLSKRIEDLRAASRLFDTEGRKKFFTLDMNNILLDIELQVQEQPSDVRAAVYSHLEAFVPCNKEALLKRLKKLSLNIQDDRLRTPLLKLKLAVCSVMPEQIARYNMDCLAKVAKQQTEEGEKNGSEDDDDEKPGKRVMGPRKKFIWDEKLRCLLCNLVRVKLGCYELEAKNTLSLEDYLKAFMETEVKPLWPKGWMQARMLFKESVMAHGHLTGFTEKKKIITTPKAKPKEAAWVQRPAPSVVAPSPASQVAKRPPQSSSDPICLDSLDKAPSLDSISQALAILGNAAKGLAHGESPPSPDGPKPAPKPVANVSGVHASPLILQQKKVSVSTPGSSTPHYISTSTSSSTMSRPLSMASASPSSSLALRVDVKPAPHRHSVLTPQRPLSIGVTKANISATVSPPKPRPPPTSSPLVAPGSKTGLAPPPTGLLKGSNNSKDTVIITSPLSRPHSHMAPKTFHVSRLSQTVPGKPSPSPTQPQTNFITPMHATLTKSSHSSVPPIVKLTPRTSSPVVSVATSSSPVPPRSQAPPHVHVYPPKSTAAYRTPLSGSHGGAKLVGFTSPSSSSSTSTSLISSVSKHTAPSASPTTASVTPSQRQRPGGGASQGVKPTVSIQSSPQVSSSSGSSLLGSAPPLSLGFGMLGGLVPVSLPFQFPSLLSLPSLNSAASSSSAGGTANSSNANFSALTQNVSQSQGGDAKRKTL